MRALAAAFDNDATLARLVLQYNNIGAQGAQSLAAALDNNSPLTSLRLCNNNIGTDGARSLAGPPQQRDVDGRGSARH
jgi:hypothetical protein